MFYPAMREPAFPTSGVALQGPHGQDASALVAGLRVGANLAGMQQNLSYPTTFHISTRLGTPDAYTTMMPGHPTFGFRGSAGVNVGSAGFEEFIAVNQVGKRFFNEVRLPAPAPRQPLSGRRRLARPGARPQASRLAQLPEGVGSAGVRLRPRPRRRAGHQRRVQASRLPLGAAVGRLRRGGRRPHRLGALLPLRRRQRLLLQGRHHRGAGREDRRRPQVPAGAAPPPRRDRRRVERLRRRGGRPGLRARGGRADVPHRPAALLRALDPGGLARLLRRPAGQRPPAGRGHAGGGHSGASTPAARRSAASTSTASARATCTATSPARTPPRIRPPESDGGVGARRGRRRTGGRAPDRAVTDERGVADPGPGRGISALRRREGLRSLPLRRRSDGRHDDSVAAGAGSGDLGCRNPVVTAEVAGPCGPVRREPLRSARDAKRVAQPPAAPVQRGGAFFTRSWQLSWRLSSPPAPSPPRSTRPRWPSRGGSSTSSIARCATEARARDARRRSRPCAATSDSRSPPGPSASSAGARRTCLRSPALTAAEVTALASHVRTAWTNDFGSVTLDEVAAVLDAPADAGDAASVWDGVFTEAQAARGAGRVHGSLRPVSRPPAERRAGRPGHAVHAPRWRGARFLREWEGRSLATLLAFTRLTDAGRQSGLAHRRRVRRRHRLHALGRPDAGRRRRAPDRRPQPRRDRDPAGPPTLRPLPCGSAWHPAGMHESAPFHGEDSWPALLPRRESGRETPASPVPQRRLPREQESSPPEPPSKAGPGP